MESRILAVSVRPLIGSTVGYVLACLPWRTEVLFALGNYIFARKEVLFALADINNAGNHYILKTANMLDRVLRSTNAAAHTKAVQRVEEFFRKSMEDGAKLADLELQPDH